MIHVGYVREITRYPIKSMAGIATESALVGWHGLEGDRRFAFRRIGDNGGFPWLSASKLPELVLYQPVGCDKSSGEQFPTHVRTPSGPLLAVGSDELNHAITERFGSAVELMQLKHGIFDEAPISVISQSTINNIGREAGLIDNLDRRRFRPNLLIETDNDTPFFEDTWIGRTLLFGDRDAAGPAVHVTMPDLRCVMINLDPDTAEKDPRLMKTVGRLNQSNAGVYATVMHTGTIRVGDRVWLER
jgi:uncharacterized protein YcbX